MSKSDSGQWWRETIDSFAMALVLAFMFRAFVAEMFVIPTGSMAPTLMGAHKDIYCDQCGFRYQCGASNEFERGSTERSNRVVIGTCCPLCRYPQGLDLAGKANHLTFPGDRILVSKLAYALDDPQRWDVVVFKFPGEARQNYIKRLIGLPGETIRIRHGDIYIRKTGEKDFTIARKPANLLPTLLQPVYDSDFLCQAALEAGVPLRWQPDGPLPAFDPASAAESGVSPSAWKAVVADDEFLAEHSAETSTAEGVDWLRYYHYVLSPLQWAQIAQDGRLNAPLPPRSARLITDYAHYNAEVSVSTSAAYDQRGIRDDYLTQLGPAGVVLGNGIRPDYDWLASDGPHWDGDLAVQAQFKWSGDANSPVYLDLVEGGIHFTVELNPTTQSATFTAREDGQELAVFPGGETRVTVPLAELSRGTVDVRFANVDDALYLWIDGDPVTFDVAGVTESWLPMEFTGEHPSTRPVASSNDAGDAAPVGIGVPAGSAVQVSRLAVSRDLYYSAINSTRMDTDDYDGRIQALSASVSNQRVREYLMRLYGEELSPADLIAYKPQSLLRDVLFSSPELWNNAPLWDSRREVAFDLGAGQYFPMGDNTLASLDARSWLPDHFVDRSLMIGRAAFIFWPHHWYRPIPFTPNWDRFGVIR